MRVGHLVVLVSLTLSAGARSAVAEGTYFSFGAGPTTVDDQLAVHTGDGGRIRMAIGHRFGQLAVEGFVAPEFFDNDMITAIGLGLDVRYILPLSEHLQTYVRGSASRLSTTIDRGYGYGSQPGYESGTEMSGRGLGAGVGLQLRGRVRALGFLYWPLFFIPAGPKVNAALFVDHGYDFYRLHDRTGTYSSLDARVTRLTFGFNVGADF